MIKKYPFREIELSFWERWSRMPFNSLLKHLRRIIFSGLKTAISCVPLVIAHLCRQESRVDFLKCWRRTRTSLQCHYVAAHNGRRAIKKHFENVEGARDADKAPLSETKLPDKNCDEFIASPLCCNRLIPADFSPIRVHRSGSLFVISQRRAAQSLIKSIFFRS